MVAKRTSSSVFEQGYSTKRRNQPSPVNTSHLKVTNVEHEEVVHQACLLITGECFLYDNSAEDYVTVQTTDAFGNASSHSWPAVDGSWKALVHLECGQNDLVLEPHHAGRASATSTLTVVYQPLLQTPPLHLAILVAKDSPLLIDCPPAKYGAFSSAHNGLDATIAKFRTTALMWQALTAEDLRKKGLDRRSFRLEEEWSNDTLSLHGARGGARGQPTPMKSVPKVHIIRIERTLAELRDPKYAQQNPRASHDQWLHEIFTQALKQHGPPFDSSCRPVVAGLIPDSHYSVEQDLILGHAALGCHNADGISLGIFGSHLTYSWPRFLDEVTTCLSDSTPPGDSVGNDNNECDSMARACSVGQGAFLHEVGHAFGADHTTGIMARGYSKSWPHNFISQGLKDDHDAKWDLEDALRFKAKPHFSIPGDDQLTSDFLKAELRIEVLPDDEEDTSALKVTSTAGLARVSLGERTFDLMADDACTEFKTSNFTGYDRLKPLQVSALAVNGKTKLVKDVWKLFSCQPWIDIPGSTIKLRKRSIKSASMDRDTYDEDHYCQWTVLLRKRGPNGSMMRASAIEFRVGATFDGAYVYYADGTRQNCGPVFRSNGAPYTFGGNSENAKIPKKARITKVELGERGGWGGLDGIRMTLSNGQVWGDINADDDRIETLEPASDEKIVGFFGTSAKYGFIKEFGIITAPKDFKVPDAVYDTKALQNLGETNDGDEDEQMSDDGSESQSTVS